MNKREKSRRAEWYAAFEQAVIKLNPALAGRIKWSEVEYFCIEGKDIAVASEVYVMQESRTEGKS